MLLLLVITTLGCQRNTIPPACRQMCSAAASLYGGCLEEWGVDWEAAGYDDEDAFVESCTTWSWEMSILSEHALEEELPGASEDWLVETCATRRDAFSADDATCSAYTDIEWNNVPWSPDDTGRAQDTP